MPGNLRPPRTVGLFGAALVPLNGMIGGTIFVLPAILFAAVGNFAPWMILLGAVAFLPICFVFARLSALFDRSGGPALYGAAAFGPFAGFQAGWLSYAASCLAFAGNAHVVVSYLALLWPSLDGPVGRPVAVSLYLAAMTAITLTGMRGAIGALASLTLLKLLPLALFIFIGLFGGDPAIGFALPQFTNLETVILLTFYAFIGFERSTMAAGEMRSPKRDIPIAILGTIGLVTFFYMLIIWAYAAIGATGGDDRMPLARAAETILGPAGAVLVTAGAAFSIGGNSLSGFVVMPRMTYGMAEQGLLPRWFLHISERFRTPSHSILFFGMLTILLGLSGGYVFLAIASTLVRLIVYMICAAALPVIRRQAGERVSAGDIFLALTAGGASLFVALQANGATWLTAAGIIAAGGLVYLGARRRRFSRLDSVGDA